MKKQISLILALAMTVGTLAACNKTDADGAPKATPTAATSTSGSDYAYVPHYIELPSDITEISKPIMIDGTLYFTASVKVGTATYSDGILDGVLVDVNEPRLYTLDVDGTGYSELSAYTPRAVPETAEPGASWTIESLVDGGDGTLWVYENGNFGYEDDDGVYISDTQTLLRKISAENGSELAVANIAANFGELPDDLDFGDMARAPASGGGSIASAPAGAGDMTVNREMRDMLSGMGISFGASFAYLRTDTAGNLYASTADGTVHVFAPNGAQLGVIDPPQNASVSNLINTPDGSAALMYRDNTGVTHITALNASTASLGEDFCTISGVSGSFTFAGIDGDGLLFYNSTGLYNVDSDGTQMQLVSWLDSDVEANGIFVLGRQGDDFLCMSGISNDGFRVQMGGGGMSVSVSSAFLGASTSVSLEMIRLVKTATADIPVRTQLSLAVNAIDENLRAEVLRFNKRSDSYRINVVDYSQYNTADDRTAGLTKLNTDILNGNIPDIILVRDLPVSTYAERGMLENLMPYLDAEPTLELVPSFLNALKSGDALYQISSGFTVSTLIGNSALVGAGDGWTIDELTAVISANPESFLLPEDIDREEVLTTILSYNLEEYVDPATGECSFNSDEFIKLIEFIRDNFSEGIVENSPTTVTPGGMGGSMVSASRIRFGESTELLTGRQLLQSKSLQGFNDLIETSVLAADSPAIKGFPAANRDGNAFSTTLALAMSSACADKDGAWEFMRGILTPEYQSSNGGRGYTGGFPSNLAVFNEQAAEAMTENTEQDQRFMMISTAGFDFDDGSLDTDGDGIKDVFPKGVIIGADISTTYYYAMEREAYDRYMEFFNSITRVAESDSKITEIVNEELKMFFAGQKTAQDTATVIQSRVQLYVNEQR